MKPLVLKSLVVFTAIAMAVTSSAAPTRSSASLTAAKIDRPIEMPLVVSESLSNSGLERSPPLDNRCFNDGAYLEKKIMLSFGVVSYQHYVCKKEEDDIFYKKMIFDKIYSPDRGTIVMKVRENEERFF